MSDLTDLRVEIEMLRGEVAGLRVMLTALATRVEALAPGDPGTRELMMIASRYAEVMESPAAGLVAREMLRSLFVWTHKVEPSRHLATLVLQAEDAGADRVPALQAWLADAHPDEIAEDMQDVLRRARERMRQPGGDETGGGSDQSDS